MTFYSQGVQNNEQIQIPLLVLNNYFQPILNRHRLIQVKSGSGIVEMNGLRFRVISPCLICLSDKDQSVGFSSDRDLETSEIVFHPALLRSDYESADPELMMIQAFICRNSDYSGIIPLDGLSAHRLEGLMSTLVDKLAKTEDDYWICRSRSFLLEALLLTDRLYLKQLQEKSEGVLENPLPNATPLVSGLLDYLQTHYEETITIESLSKQFHVNRTTLNQTFKKELKIPITQYLIELRIEVAKMLLKATRLQVNEIMTRVGYTDLAHFNRTFKQRVGYSPSKYREKYSDQ